MSVLHALRTSVLAACCLTLACGAPARPNEQRFEATLRVVSDDAEPLSGAKFSLGQHSIGTTGASGTLKARLRGSEGQTLGLSLECPEGYSPPLGLPPLRLTRMRRVGEQAAHSLSFDAICTRQTRNVALVVHATGGNALPVLVNGSARATTDADGNAHLLLQVDRGESAVAVKLDTSARPELKPQEPERLFELRGRDAVLLFEASFSTAPAKKRLARSAPVSAAPRHVPYRVD